jgi:hypothetical protein
MTCLAPPEPVVDARSIIDRQFVVELVSLPQSQSIFASMLSKTTSAAARKSGSLDLEDLLPLAPDLDAHSFDFSLDMVEVRHDRPVELRAKYRSKQH